MAMMLANLHKFFTAPTDKTKKSTTIFWFSLSLTFAAIYSLLAMRQAFSAEYVVQDDARQHIFWMQQFLEPELFSNDLIAKYFKSVAPSGYAALYKLMATVGITPLLLSKLLPLILGIITTIYCFRVCLQLLPVPAAGFIASLMLNQSLWMQDGLISATPKAFIYAIFMAFLYYLLRRSLLLMGMAIAFLGLFYPQGVFICAGILILQLLQWQQGRPRLSKARRDYLFCLTGLIVAFIVMLPYALNTSEFAPTITAAEAKTLPEFLPGGRSSFFIKDPWKFWLHGRSGIGLSSSLTPAFMATGFLLPLLLHYRDRFPLAKQVSDEIKLLTQIIIASLAMFFAAHALLFKLHLPSRYSQHSLRIVMAISGAIAIVIILDTLLAMAGNLTSTPTHLVQGEMSKRVKSFFLLPIAVLLLTCLIFYPNLTMKKFPWTYYVVGGEPALYEFFQKQPKDILVASLAEEANNLPTFAHRAILVGREYAVPYHKGYYQKFRDRTLELIQAQYSPDLADVQKLIQKYDIDFWLLERGAFNPEYIAKNSWLTQYQPAAAEAIARLNQSTLPALANVVKRCSVFEKNSLVVLRTDCITKNYK